MSVVNPKIQPGISTAKDQPKSLFAPPKVDDHQYIPKEYKEAAANMEQQFAEILLSQMERTVDESPGESGGETGVEYYKSLQRSERAKMMANQNTLGLQEMILNQIYPTRLRNELALKQYEDQTHRIHKNLPSYNIDKKADTIEMRKNESPSTSDEKTFVSANEDGGLP